MPPVAHLTAHTDGIGPFLAGCTCGWQGTVRMTAQGVITDEILHRQATQICDRDAEAIFAVADRRGM